MIRYNLYKDSGVELFGEIPNNWDVVRLKYLCDIGTGNRDTINKEEDGEFPFFVRSKTVEKISSYSYDCEAILTAGDGDICKIWHYIDGKFDCHQRVYKLNNFRRIDGKFLYYFLMENFEKEVFKLSAKSTVDSLRRPMFENFNVCFPEIKFQKQIVAYLDKKTAIVDTLIASKEQKINLLKEKRTALINHIITKGLDPKVKLKDSGVEWIGEIPAHWEMKKIFYFGKVTLGKMLTPENKGGDFLKFYLRSKNIQNEKVDISDVKEMWFSENELNKLRLLKNDLLLNEGGDVGRTCIWNDELEECYFQNSVNIIRFEYDNPKFFLFVSMLYHTVGYYDSLVNRVSIPHLTKEKLESVRFIRPSFKEQQQIVEYLDTHTQEINELISLEQKKIETLKEYRQALISEVVTGKIKVVKD